jgi:hypothetical protein
VIQEEDESRHTLFALLIENSRRSLTQTCVGVCGDELLVSTDSRWTVFGRLTMVFLNPRFITTTSNEYFLYNLFELQYPGVTIVTF